MRLTYHFAHSQASVLLSNIGLARSSRSVFKSGCSSALILLLQFELLFIVVADGLNDVDRSVGILLDLWAADAGEAAGLRPFRWLGLGRNASLQRLLAILPELHYI